MLWEGEEIEEAAGRISFPLTEALAQADTVSRVHEQTQQLQPQQQKQQIPHHGMSIDLKGFHIARHAAAEQHLHHAAAHGAGEHLGHGAHRHQIGHQIGSGIAKDQQGATCHLLTQMQPYREHLQQGRKAAGQKLYLYLYMDLHLVLTTNPPQWT